MCINREKCEKVFRDIELLRTYCRVTTSYKNDISEKTARGKVEVKSGIRKINRCFDETTNAAGQVTKLIWQLCPDCRCVFYSKPKKRKGATNEQI